MPSSKLVFDFSSQWPFQHITCRSSARHLRDLRCSPPLLDRLYRPIALHFDTLHVRRRPLLVEKSYISCWPVSCKFCCFARRSASDPPLPVPSHRAYSGQVGYICYLPVLLLYLLRSTTGGPLSIALGPTQCLCHHLHRRASRFTCCAGRN